MGDWYLVLEPALGTVRIIGPFTAKGQAQDYGSQHFPLFVRHAAQIEPPIK